MSETPKVFTNPEEIRTPAQEIRDIARRTDNAQEWIAQEGIALKEGIDELHEQLSVLENRLTPQEKSIFQDRIEEIKRELEDIREDGKMNESIPPDFRDVFIFNPSSGILRIKGSEYAIQFLPEEMPLEFHQVGDGSRSKLKITSKGANGEPVSFDLSYEYKDEKRIIVCSDKSLLPPVEIEDIGGLSKQFLEMVNSFSFTGNFDNDFTELQRMYKEITSLGRDDIFSEPLSKLAQHFENLGTEYPKESREMPDVNKAEYLRRRAYLKLIDITTTPILSGALQFKEPTQVGIIRVFRDSFDDYQKSIEIFKKAKNNDFTETGITKSKSGVNNLLSILSKNYFWIDKEQVSANQIDADPKYESLKRLKQEIKQVLEQ